MPKAERPLAAAIEFRNTGMREALEEAERNRYSALDEREEEEQTEREEYRTNELYWARLSLAHGGDPQAQCDIGLCFAKGEHGFSQDDEEAVTWFLRAAEQGNPQALYQLGNMAVRAAEGSFQTQDWPTNTSGGPPLP